MSKLLDNVYKNSIWIILVLSIFGYLAYYVLNFQGSFETAVKDWQTWVHLAFVIYLNVTMVTGAYDSGTSKGIDSPEFKYADELNNKIVKSVNNEMDDFRSYIKDLNASELKNIQDDYLFSIGDKKLEELTPKERKKYDKLKPVQHNIYGFNLPLYYEMTRSGKINYRASIRKNQGKIVAQLRKVITGLMFGAMTVNMSVQVGNLGAALTSLSVIMVGLGITFVLGYVKQVVKFKFEIPKKVILKHTLYSSYTEYKNKTHKLENIIDKQDKNN